MSKKKTILDMYSKTDATLGAKVRHYNAKRKKGYHEFEEDGKCNSCGKDMGECTMNLCDLIREEEISLNFPWK